MGASPAGEIAAVEPRSSADKLAKHVRIVKDSIYRSIELRGLPAHKVGPLWKSQLLKVDASVRGRAADRPENETLQ